MSDPADMMVPQLREMRAEDLVAHEPTLMTLDKCQGGAEAARKSFRQAPTADNLLSKLVTGVFEESVESLGNKVRELEGRK